MRKSLTDGNRVNEVYQRIIAELSAVVIGKEDLKMVLMLALVAHGHLLIEGLVGSGKTKLARSFAETINGGFKRIRFTPDIMPADVTALNHDADAIASHSYRLQGKRIDAVKV